MERHIPENLKYFLKNGIKDIEDGYEYASELNRILNSDDCQKALSNREIEMMRDYSERAKKVGEINHYTEEKIKEIEKEMFGSAGIEGFLGIIQQARPIWPF